MPHQLPLLAAPKQALQPGLQEEAGQNLKPRGLALPVSLMPTPSSQAGLPWSSPPCPPPSPSLGTQEPST